MGRKAGPRCGRKPERGRDEGLRDAPAAGPGAAGDGAAVQPANRPVIRRAAAAGGPPQRHRCPCPSLDASVVAPGDLALEPCSVAAYRAACDGLVTDLAAYGLDIDSVLAWTRF